MTVKIEYVASSRRQKCQKCGEEILAREKSVKVTKTRRGRVSLTQTSYLCMDCARACAKDKANGGQKDA